MCELGQHGETLENSREWGKLKKALSERSDLPAFVMGSLWSRTSELPLSRETVTWSSMWKFPDMNVFRSNQTCLIGVLVGTAVIVPHRLSGLNNKHVFLMIRKLRCPGSRCWRVQSLVRACFLAHSRRGPHCVLTRQKGRGSLCGFPAREQIPFPRALALWTWPPQRSRPQMPPLLGMPPCGYVQSPRLSPQACLFLLHPLAVAIRRPRAHLPRPGRQPAHALSSWRCWESSSLYAHLLMRKAVFYHLRKPFTT